MVLRIVVQAEDDGGADSSFAIQDQNRNHLDDAPNLAEAAVKAARWCETADLISFTVELNPV